MSDPKNEGDYDEENIELVRRALNLLWGAEVKQLRAENAALTATSIHTGTSPAETIDALASEVAGLRARLGAATRLLDGCVGMLLRARAILHVRKIAVTDWKKKVAALLAEWESTKGGS